jgi:hypothetical protein
VGARLARLGAQTTVTSPVVDVRWVASSKTVTTTRKTTSTGEHSEETKTKLEGVRSRRCLAPRPHGCVATTCGPE